MKKRWTLGIAALFMSGAVGCADAGSNEGLVARVGDYELTVEGRRRAYGSTRRGFRPKSLSSGRSPIFGSSTRYSGRQCRSIRH